GCKVIEEGIEGVTVHREHVDAREAPDRRRPRLVTDQRYLAEALARTEAAERDVALTGHVLRHFHLAVHEDVEPVAAVALAEDDLVRLVIRPPNALRVLGLQLRDVGWQDQVERPVGRDADLAVEPRELQEVDRAPEPPREKA